ncbi:hypothetical protein ACE14D_25020, partial [Streptomyces sp. Act-28]
MRRIQTGNALSAFGLGFTVPYLYVYVAQVRGLGAGAAGAVLAVFAMAALAVLPFTGRTIDRRGPLPVLVGAALLAALGALATGGGGAPAPPRRGGGAAPPGRGGFRMGDFGVIADVSSVVVSTLTQALRGLS